MRPQRIWNPIKLEEELFLKKPTYEHGVVLGSLWKRWIDEKGYESNMTIEFGEQRCNLYRAFVNGHLTIEEILEEIRYNPVEDK